MYGVVFKFKKYNLRWRKIFIQIYADFPNHAFLVGQILQSLAGVVSTKHFYEWKSIFLYFIDIDIIFRTYISN